MVETETLIHAILIASLGAIAFLWGMHIGRRLENKEVKKVAGFLLTLREQGTFKSPQMVDAAYIVAKWLADDNRCSNYFSDMLSEEKKSPNKEENDENMEDESGSSGNRELERAAERVRSASSPQSGRSGA